MFVFFVLARVNVFSPEYSSFLVERQKILCLIGVVVVSLAFAAFGGLMRIRKKLRIRN